MSIKNTYSTSIRMVALFLILIMSMSFPASALDGSTKEMYNSVDSMLSELNEEYGTDFHILSADEMKSFGLDKYYDVDKYGLTKEWTEQELLQLEKTLRYVAEIKIPEYEIRTQQAHFS